MTQGTVLLSLRLISPLHKPLYQFPVRRPGEETITDIVNPELRRIVLLEVSGGKGEIQPIPCRDEPFECNCRHKVQGAFPEPLFLVEDVAYDPCAVIRNKFKMESSFLERLFCFFKILLVLSLFLNRKPLECCIKYSSSFDLSLFIEMNVPIGWGGGVPVVPVSVGKEPGCNGHL